jgi:hypothetical protein
MIDSEIERKEKAGSSHHYIDIESFTKSTIPAASALRSTIAGQAYCVLRISYRVLFSALQRKNCGDAIGCCSNQPINILGQPVADTPGKGSIPRPDSVAQP